MQTLITILIALVLGTANTVVVHVQSTEVAPLHVEVLLPDGAHFVSATSDGVCRFTGCNAVGTTLTMTETITFDRPGTYVITGYASAPGASATEPITVTIPYRFYIP